MAESLIIDPTSVDATNVQLEMQDPASGIVVQSFDAPHPDINVQYAQSMDTEGGQSVAAAYQNRTITVAVRCFDTAVNGGQMMARVKQLQQKVGKLQREGGVIQLTLKGGEVIRFTALREVKLEVPLDVQFRLRGSATCTLTVVCRPIGYGNELALSDHSETSLPVLRFTEGTIPGDVAALGRLVVDNDSSSDQLWLQWGLRSKTYSGTATAGLFFEAESRLRQGGAVLAARSGASGGTVVRQGTLTTSYQSMLSLVSSGTVYCQHVGSYNLMARVYDPGGTAGVTSGGTVGNVSLAAEWAVGDFVQVTRNDPVSPAVINDYSIVNLGQVHIPKVTTGTQRWDARVLAKGTDFNQSVDVDCVWLNPVDEGSGVVEASVVVGASTQVYANDSFTGTPAGTALNGRTAPVGGSWATSGATTDYFFVDQFGTTAEFVARNTDSDSDWRYAVLGSTNFAEVDVSARITSTASPPADFYQGILVRYQSSATWLAFIARTVSATGGAFLYVWQKKSGTNSFWALNDQGPVVPGADYILRAVVYGTGLGIFTVLSPTTGAVMFQSRMQNADWSLSGGLSLGKPGLIDQNSGSTGAIRLYDDFFTAVPNPADAAVYANQSLEVRSDRVQRENSGGAVWGPVGKYEGNYLFVPPSGQEGRTTEVIVKLSRGVPESMGDSGIDDLSAQLFVTPRYLNVPES